MELSTERLALRPLRESDLPQMQRYATRPEFYRYNPIEEQTAETVAAFLQQELEQQRNGDGGRHVFAVEPKDVGFIVGTLRIEVQDVKHGHGDLGYALDSDYQGQGYMSEAVRRVLSFGFDSFRLHRIWATCDVDNTPSWRLMERVGMTREGTLREDKYLRGVRRNSFLYSILASDPRL